MLEEYIVFTIVLGAVLYLGWYFKGRSGQGCSSCGKTGLKSSSACDKSEKDV